MSISSIIEALRCEATGDERDGVWEEGYADALHDVESAVGVGAEGQLVLFAEPLAGLRLDPTPAMQRGDQQVFQCSCCGAVVVNPKPGRPAGACPCCLCAKWWEQKFPLAGLSEVSLANGGPP